MVDKVGMLFGSRVSLYGEFIPMTGLEGEPQPISTPVKGFQSGCRRRDICGGGKGSCLPWFCDTPLGMYSNREREKTAGKRKNPCRSNRACLTRGAYCSFCDAEQRNYTIHHNWRVPKENPGQYSDNSIPRDLALTTDAFLRCGVPCLRGR